MKRFTRTFLVCFIWSLVESSIHLYYIEDSLQLEFYDCFYHNNLLYCRCPVGPIPLQRDNTIRQCYYNGTQYFFSSLQNQNMSIDIILHQWKSSIEKLEEYMHL